MNHDVQQSIALLAHTPAAFNALLRDLPAEWTHSNEGGETWSVFDVIGHLTYADRVDWIPRTRRILASGETRPFDPFNRQGHVEECRGKDLPQLLDEFARVRSVALEELRAMNLQPAQLELRGRHPSLGIVTLSELLATWAVHDMTHLHQISRILAHQYREATGPFAAYLGVLQCAGHSAP
jgi:hypothetical protein